MERFATGAFVVVVACAAVVGLLAVAWAVVAPYAGWAASGVIVTWCVAAAAVAPGEDTTPLNDHEDEAGEQARNPARETDPTHDWNRQKASIRRFVEGAVAEGAAGHREEKGRGATVDSLLAELQERGSLPEWDPKRMIDFLERAGIPVRKQMSFFVTREVDGKPKKVKKNLPAVHVDDLTKELGKTPALPSRFVPDITPGRHPHLAAAAPPAEGPVEAPAEAPAEGPVEAPVGAPDEGRYGVA
jgi:hypothetical protein